MSAESRPRPTVRAMIAAVAGLCFGAIGLAARVVEYDVLAAVLVTGIASSYVIVSKRRSDAAGIRVALRCLEARVESGSAFTVMAVVTNHSPWPSCPLRLERPAH